MMRHFPAFSTYVLFFVSFFSSIILRLLFVFFFFFFFCSFPDACMDTSVFFIKRGPRFLLSKFHLFNS
jgi:hypothetical protein